MFTRRCLLSYVSSVYDPLSIVSPFVLIAKQIFQDDTGLTKGWDEALEEANIKQFRQWLTLLPDMKHISIPRCMIPPKMARIFQEQAASTEWSLSWMKTASCALAFASPTQTCREAKNQALLSANSHVALLIARQIHETEKRHTGTEFVLSYIRQKCWITRARVIRSLLHQCVTCKLLHAKPRPQRITDLPPDRVMPYSSPFSNVGVDCFGPFYCKRGRSTEKRYGCLFTCVF